MQQLYSLFTLIIFFALVGCGESKREKSSTVRRSEKAITDPMVQDSLFTLLINSTGESLETAEKADTLSILILPVTSSCPNCRKKTMDSIIKYQERLDQTHWVIISGPDKRTIKGYFEQVDRSLPAGNRIYFDTLATSKPLSSTNPNVYYSSKGKVHIKVSCMPATIKEDLAEFFAHL